MEAMWTATIGRRTLEIYHDDCPFDPRAQDNAGRIVSFCNEFGGDAYETEADHWLELTACEIDGRLENMLELTYRCVVTGEFGSDVRQTQEDAFGVAREKMIRQVLDEQGLFLGLRYQEHGPMCNLSLTTGEDPDGYAYITAETIKEQFGEGSQAWERARRCLEGEVEIYGQWLSGEVYGFRLLERAEDASEDDEGDEVESCWGFYGDDWQNNGIADYVGADNADLVAALS